MFAVCIFHKDSSTCLLWAICTISMNVESCGKLQNYCISGLHYCLKQLLTTGCRDVQIKPVGIMPGVGERQERGSKPVAMDTCLSRCFGISIHNFLIFWWTHRVNYYMIAWWYYADIPVRALFFILCYTKIIILKCYLSGSQQLRYEPSLKSELQISRGIIASEEADNTCECEFRIGPCDPAFLLVVLLITGWLMSESQLVHLG